MPVHAESYTVLRQGAQITTEIERRGSRFQTVLHRVSSADEAQAMIDQLRRGNSSARHVCSAWVLGPQQDEQRAHDDGEPSGTAGPPMLGALLRSDMPGGDQDFSDVLAVVLRWFGGTLLGTGGLVSAYSDSVVQAVQHSADQGELLTRVRTHHYDVLAPTAQAGRWENDLRAAGVQVRSTEYSADGSQARIQVSVPESRAQIEDLTQRVASLSSGRVIPVDAGQGWLDRSAP